MQFQNPTANAIYEVIANLAKSGQWRAYSGPNLDQLRSLLGASFGREHVRLCCSGTLGVELALRALKLSGEDEVLLAGYDYPGNFRAIQEAGGRVALCDVRRGGWVPTLAEIESAASECTKAIVVSHLHGDLAPMESICEWARSRNIAVVEDACQEPGAELSSGVAGSFGDISVLSFGGSKVISSGRGGAVLTNNAQFAQRMTIYCERGNDSYALSEMQAAIVIPQLQALPRDNAKRRAESVKLIRGLSGFSWIKSQIALPATGAYYKFGMSLQPNIAHAAQVQHLVQNQHGSEQSSLRVAREFVLQYLTDAGLRIGPGFHGFTKRSGSRCRKSGTLESSQYAAESTIVLSHEHLLDPNDGSSSVEEVLNVFESLNRDLGI